MALDTQPLSRVRRLVMLAVLLAIFAVSVAFASHIADQRRDMRLVLSVTPPKGFVHTAEPDLGDGQTILCPLLGHVNGGNRMFFLYFEPLFGPATNRTVALQAVQHFSQLFGAQPKVAANTLAGYSGFQLSAEFGDQGFGIMRAAAIRGRFVAVVYSGDTPYAAADSAALDQLAGSALQIRTARTH